MPSAAYFRRQADICLRLALIASDDEVSNRLIVMAREYTAKGDALAGQSGADAPPGAARPFIIRSPSRASSMDRKCKNALRGAERSSPRNGGTINVFRYTSEEKKDGGRLTD